MAVASTFPTSEDDPKVSPYHARSNDATKLTLPISAVVVLVISVAGFAIQQAMSLAALRSDVRDIKTLLDSQRDNIELKMQNIRLEMEKGELRKALLERMNPSPK